MTCVKGLIDSAILIVFFIKHARAYEVHYGRKSSYNSNSRYHPQTFHNVEHELKPEGSQQMNINNFHNIPEELETGEDSQIQYAYQGGETHEGEVINTDENYMPAVSSYDMQSHDVVHDHNVGHYDPHMGYNYGYHYHPPPPKPTQRPFIPQKSKQHSAPYTYYYIGRHLWYVPLYFSIYFIVYVGLLVLKSIARHKVLFPENLQSAAAGLNARDLHALDSIDEHKNKFFMK